MGFLSSLTGATKQKVPASGFYAMPPQYQSFYKGLLDQANQTLLPGGKINADMFTPLAETADESRAYSMMRQGFAPTAQSLQSDISMQMNPYDRFVIDEINRQSGGDYSILKQALNEAGQMGSNRQMLGANDIDLSRMNQIGAFKQQGYNTALNNAMNVLPEQRRMDASGMLDIGTQQRNLDLATKQAPYSALSAGMSALQGIPSQFGQFGTPETTIKQGGSLLNLVKTGAQLYAMSDRRLKQDVKDYGEENGHKTYEFSYRDDPEKRRYIGVMADEVAEKMPDAVTEIDGYLAVNYPMIGVNYREAI